jgi:FKBP-type peptidyl-prolyl cis-trans isomerase FkpA
VQQMQAQAQMGRGAPGGMPGGAPGGMPDGAQTPPAQ